MTYSNLQCHSKLQLFHKSKKKTTIHSIVVNKSSQYIVTSSSYSVSCSCLAFPSH